LEVETLLWMQPRTAKRLVGADGQVRILYRRTIKQMPANYEEIKAVLDESIEIQELVNPLSVSMIGGKLTGLVCQKNETRREG
jgi:putative selenate reductase